MATGLRSSGRAIFRIVSPKAWDGGGSSTFRNVALTNLKTKASNTLSAVQETYFSTKQVFESHRVVFTIGTSIASILTAWAGYSLRQHHQSKIEKRLRSIEEVLKNNYEVEQREIKKNASSGNVSNAACIAAAWTSLVIGYGLGWRGGAWYTNRKIRMEHLKLMGQIKPQRWQFLRRPFVKFRNSQPVHRIEESPPVADVCSLTAQQSHKSQ